MCRRWRLVILPLCVRADTSLVEDLEKADASTSLEELAYIYGTDKSKDDHKYVDLYSTLFDPIRWKVRNVSEVGVASGQSLQMWADYFANARVWGIDKNIHNTVRKVLTANKRVRLMTADAYAMDDRMASKLGWAEETMDIIIDDAQHAIKAKDALLVRYWRFVRPGGFFVIEDVGPKDENVMRDISPSHLPHWTDDDLSPEARRILRENTCYLVDASFGHRNYTACPCNYTNIQPPFTIDPNCLALPESASYRVLFIRLMTCQTQTQRCGERYFMSARGD